MASRFETTFLFDRQSELALTTEIKQENEQKDTMPENGSFILLGYISKE
jgi:hypothetical protein